MAPREGESTVPGKVKGLAEVLLLPLLLITGILLVLVLPTDHAAKYRIAIVALLLLAALPLLWAALGDLFREQKDPEKKGPNPMFRIFLLAAAAILAYLAIRVWASPALESGLPLFPVETGIYYFGVLLLIANGVVLGILGLKGTEKPPPDPPEAGEPPKPWWWTDIRMVNVLGVIIGSILYAGWFLPRIVNILWCWGIAMVLVLFLMAAVGCLVNRRFTGVLINEYNCMSLSRFQMVLWTVLILAAIAVVLLIRMPVGTGLEGAINPAANCTAGEITGADEATGANETAGADETTGLLNPFCVEIDWRLLALMGISVTTAAGAVLGNAKKVDRIPTKRAQTKFGTVIYSKKKREELGKVMDEYKNNPTMKKEVDAIIEEQSAGTKFQRKDPALAEFSDIFCGDEIADHLSLSIGKVQNFFFTVVAVVIYAALLFTALPGYDAAIFIFPGIPDVLLGIIAISHGGYLGDKFLPHTEEQK